MSTDRLMDYSSVSTIADDHDDGGRGAGRSGCKPRWIGIIIGIVNTIAIAYLMYFATSTSHKIDDLENEVAWLQRSKNDFKSELRDVRSTLASKENKHEDVTEIKRDLKTQMEKNEKSLSNQIKSLKGEVARFNESIQTLKKETARIHSLESEVARLNDSVHLLNQETVPTINESLQNHTRRLSGNVKDVEHLKFKAKLNEKVPTSCSEYLLRGVTTSDWYHLDPDGYKQGDPPIMVYCNFENGQTEVGHGAEDLVDIQPCSTDGCFSRNVSYNASLNQIRHLIEVSENCHQEIHFECSMAGLDGFASWLDWNGQAHYYIDKPKSGPNSPNVTEGMSCRGQSRCNCDAVSNATDWLEDSGVVADSAVLPIAAFRYGHLKGEARFMVGKLKCAGQANFPQKVETACANFKLNGHHESRIYLVEKNNASNMLTAVACDMTKSLSDPGLQITLGNISLLSPSEPKPQRYPSPVVPRSSSATSNRAAFCPPVPVIVGLAVVIFQTFRIFD